MFNLSSFYLGRLFYLNNTNPLDPECVSCTTWIRLATRCGHLFRLCLNPLLSLVLKVKLLQLVFQVGFISSISFLLFLIFSDLSTDNKTSVLSSSPSYERFLVPVNLVWPIPPPHNRTIIPPSYIWPEPA